MFFFDFLGRIQHIWCTGHHIFTSMDMDGVLDAVFTKKFVIPDELIIF